MIKRRRFLIALMSLGIISAVWAIQRGSAPPPKPTPIAFPPEKPFAQCIAGSGLIEALGENILIGCPESGIVEEVFVRVGDQVKKGDPLFKLETATLNWDWKVAEAKEAVALASYRKVQDQLSRLLAVKDTRAISQEELQLKQNEKNIAEASFKQAVAEKEKIEKQIDRLTVKSPQNGVILRKNLKAGEYLVATDIEHPPLILGDVARFQIRIDIDEQNASRLISGASAIAYPKNQPGYAIPLVFDHIEPCLVPKISLTGSSREKVDTRVLQVVYTFDSCQQIPLYVGQQMEVYIQREGLPTP